MNPGSAGRRSAIESALLDYHRSPGKYALIRKQPEILFLSVKDVLQLASGRSPDGDEAAGPTAAVQRAACFFIRAALLYPDADHYALLGVDRDAPAAVVKDRYRMMMRLMHPDFASTLSGANWPADAASRVNRAYEVLSSTAQRTGYNEKLNPSVQPRSPRTELRTTTVRAPVSKPHVEDPRRRLKQLATVFGAVGGVALLATLVTANSADKETLVQRSREVAAPDAAPRPAATATVSAVLGGSAGTTPPVVAQIMAVELAPDATAAPDVTPPPQVMPSLAMTDVMKPPPRPISFASAVLAPVSAAAVAPAPTPLALQAVAQISPAPGPVAPPPALVPITTPSAVATTSPTPIAKGAPPNPGVTLNDVHTVLSKLLQQLESGWGDRVLGMVERDARSAPASQALLAHYNELVGGMRPVKLSNVRFNAEPREGYLLVKGEVQMHVRDQSPGTPAKRLALQMEFALRDGAVVMTRLGRGQE